MTPLSHLVFGAAIAVLMAVALMLLFPGTKDSSRAQQAHVTSSPSVMHEPVADPTLSRLLGHFHATRQRTIRASPEGSATLDRPHTAPPARCEAPYCDGRDGEAAGD
jgi:hypothetical protein